MLRREAGKFSRMLGIAYIVFQVAGAILGAFVAWIFTGSGGNLTLDGSAGSIVGGFVCEFIGSFFLVFIYLTQTEEKTMFSKDPSITTLIISASYTAARQMTGAPYATDASCLNPAIAIATNLTMLFDKNSKGFEYAYVFLPMPFVGALVAVIFHEVVYKKTMDAIQ